MKNVANNQYTLDGMSAPVTFEELYMKFLRKKADGKTSS